MMYFVKLPKILEKFRRCCSKRQIVWVETFFGLSLLTLRIYSILYIGMEKVTPILKNWEVTVKHLVLQAMERISDLFSMRKIRAW